MFSADLGGYTAPPPAATDPPFQKVALLLHGDGTNGEQNNTFVDGSSNNFTITRTGNVAQGTFSPFSLADGQWSNYFDGNGDYLGVPTGVANFGTSDFTIECWVNYASANGDIIDTRGSSYLNGAIAIRLDGTSLYTVFGATTTITTPVPTSNTWHHISVCRASGSTKLFVDGVQKGSTYADSNNYGDFYSLIGSYAGGAANYLAGYISNMRIVKGTALYTSNFTPSTTPLTAITNTSLLTCQSNRFKDNSSNNFTITPAGDTKVTAFSPFAPSAAYSASTNGGSAYFDGSGDYLTTPTGVSNFGTGDFTVEFWVYYASQTGTYDFVDARGASYTNQGFAVYTYNGSIYVTWSTNNHIITTAPAANVWNHIAVCRSSGVTKLYLNGVQTGSTPADTNNYGDYYVNIGQLAGGGSYYLSGYMSNVRIVKGTAIYTANFTPPTAPLTAVANTQLLLNCTNAGIIDNAGKNDIETVGNAQISTSVKKYGTGSMYFDGTGDYLTATTPDGFTPGTSDFTIEAWIYPASATLGNIVSQRSSGGISFRYNSNGTLNFFYSGGLSQFSSTLTAPLNTWTHVAATRSGNTVKLWVNGVNSGTNTGYSASISGSLINIGSYQSAEFFNGYIDDLRITKGQALYTANFTPPTQAFTNV